MAWSTDVRTAIVSALTGIATGGVEDSRMRPYAVGSSGSGVAQETFPRLNVATRRLRRESRGAAGSVSVNVLELVVQVVTVGDVEDVASVIAAAETIEEAAHVAIMDPAVWRPVLKVAPTVLHSETDATVTGSQVVCSILQTWEMRGSSAQAAGRGDDLQTVVTTLTTTPKPTVIATVDDLDE